MPEFPKIPRRRLKIRRNPGLGAIAKMFTANVADATSLGCGEIVPSEGDSIRSRLGYGAESDSSFFKFYGIFSKLPKDFLPVMRIGESLKIREDIKNEDVFSRFSDFQNLFLEAGKSSVSGWYLTPSKDLLNVHLERGHLVFKLHGSDFKAFERFNEYTGRFGDFLGSAKKECGVWAQFTHYTNYVQRRSAFLNCPVWSDIRCNYQSPLREDLSNVVSSESPWSRGKLLILHGSSGTGKTTFIRSLMMAWRDRFNMIVTADPEVFSNTPDYYLNLCNLDELDEFDGVGGDYKESPEEGEDGAKRRNLIVMEDSADLVITESRGTHASKISKLLNMTDGLFGQGREDIFVVTFNEKVDAIDPAFLRPGRCIASLEFENFNCENANQWLRARGIEKKVRDEVSLAHLYEILYRHEDERRKRVS